MLNCFVKIFLGYLLWQFATFSMDLGYKPPKNYLATLISGNGWMHLPQKFLRGDDNAFITPNIGRNCYAIAIKHSMSGDG